MQKAGQEDCSASLDQEILTVLERKMTLYLQNQWKDQWEEKLFISILDSCCFKLAIRSFIKEVVQREKDELLERITNLEKAFKVYYSLHTEE
jgi:hypothetical protein